MVLVEVKRLPKEEYSKDYDVFIVSMPGTTRIADATEVLQRMQNTRVRLQWMVAAAKQLLKDSVLDENQQHHLQGPITDAENYLSLDRAEKRLTCTQEELDAIADTFKGGAMILFPTECSGADACQRLAAVLDDDAATDNEKSKCHRLLSLIDDGATNEKTLVGPCVMWWSAKPMAADADFTKYVGKNEKTKITVKLAPQGAAAPPREPVIDARAQQELMTHYYRKQEEMKKVIEDEDITYGNSDWANPHGLKHQLQGIDNIKYRPR